MQIVNKKAFWLMLPLIAGLALIVGCSKDKGSGNNNNGRYCDQFGCYDDRGYDYRYNLNPNAVLLTGSTTVSSSKNWKSAIDVLIDCRVRIPNYIITGACRQYAGSAPRIDITIDDYKKFSTAVNKPAYSTGTVTISSQLFQGYEMPVVWDRIANPLSVSADAFEAVIYGYNDRPIYIHLYGRATDSSLQVRMFYGYPSNPNDPSTLVSSGRVTRLNRPIR